MISVDILIVCSVLITSSLKFRSMLNSKFCEGSPPVLQINDIRYEIFDTVKDGVLSTSKVTYIDI